MCDFEALQKSVLDSIVPLISNTAFVLQEGVWCINQKHPESIAAAGIGIAIRLATEERPQWSATDITNWLQAPSSDLQNKTPISYCRHMSANPLQDFRRSIANSAL